MRSQIFAAAIATLMAAPVLAADLPGRDGPISPGPIFQQFQPHTWTGFYAGLNAGYGWGSYNRAAATLMGKGSGGVLGAQMGYNYQFSNLVLGVEGDLNASWISGNRSPLAGTATSGSLDWFGTLRGRLGFAADRALIYGTGGYAGGQVKSTIVDTVVPFSETTSSWRSGWAMGGGIEYAFTNRVSAKAEYLYMNLGSRLLFPVNAPVSSTYSVSLIRGGVNYRF